MMILSDVYDDCNVPILNLIRPSPTPSQEQVQELGQTSLQPGEIIVRSESGTVWRCSKSELASASKKLGEMIRDIEPSNGITILKGDYIVQTILYWSHATGLAPARAKQELSDPREVLADLFEVAHAYEMPAVMRRLRGKLNTRFIRDYPVAAMVFSVLYDFESERVAAEILCFTRELPPEDDENDIPIWHLLSIQQRERIKARRLARATEIMHAMDTFLNKNKLKCSCNKNGETYRGWPLGWKRWYNYARREILVIPATRNICARNFALQGMKDSECLDCERTFRLVSRRDPNTRQGDIMLEKFKSLCRILLVPQEPAL